MNELNECMLSVNHMKLTTRAKMNGYYRQDSPYRHDSPYTRTSPHLTPYNGHPRAHIRDVWNHTTLGTYTNSWSNLVAANSIQLFRANALTGLTTNLAILRPGGVTNTLVFKKGLLIDVR